MNEFLYLQIEGNFFSSSVILDEIVGKYEIDTGIDEISTVEPPAKRQCISVPPFEGFAELHNQFRNIVTEDSTVNDSSVPEEHTSLEGELTLPSDLEDISYDELISLVNEEQPLSSLQFLIVDTLPAANLPLSYNTLDKEFGFNHKNYAPSDLEEVCVEQSAKSHTYYHNN